MTDKKTPTPHDATPPTTEPEDELPPALSDDPFSSENEVTIIQPLTDDVVPVTIDEVTEVSQISFNTEITDHDIPAPEFNEKGETSAAPHEKITEPENHPITTLDAQETPRVPRPRFSFPKLPLKKMLKIFFAFAVLVLAFPLIDVAIRHALRPHTIKTPPPPVTPIHLTAVVYTDPPHSDPTPIVTKSGKSVTFKFFIDAWPDTEKHDLNFNLDFRIYSQYGQLLEFKPGQLHYTGKLNQDIDKLEVTERVMLARTLSPGYYRVRLDVSAAESRLNAITETKIRVVP